MSRTLRRANLISFVPDALSALTHVILCLGMRVAEAGGWTNIRSGDDAGKLRF
jgi:hypothetical protein